MKAMSRSALRFLLVGGAFSLVYSASTALLIGLVGTPPVATSLLVYLACIPPAFACQRRFAFGVERARPGALGLYAMTQGLSMAIVSSATALFVTREVVQDTLVILAASAVAAVVSFVISRFVIFAPQP